MERLIVQNLSRDEWKDFFFYPSPGRHGAFGDRFDINASERPKPAELITLEAFEASYGQVRFIRIFPFQQLVIHTKNLVVMIRNGSCMLAPDRVAFYPCGEFGDLLEYEIRDIPQIPDCIREVRMPTLDCCSSYLTSFFSELNLAIARHQLGTISMALEPDDALPYAEDDPEAAAKEPKTVFQATLWRDSYPSAILNFREDGSAFTQSSEEEEFKQDGEAEPWWSMMEKVVTFWQHLHLEGKGKEWKKPIPEGYVDLAYWKG